MPDIHPTPQDRFNKWHDRQAEWARLAEQSTDPHIGSVWRSLAAQAQEMAGFWLPMVKQSVDPPAPVPAGSAD